MPAGLFDFVGDFAIEKGVTLNRPINWKPGGVVVPLTGYTARMQVRPNITSTIVLLELTTENGGIVIIPATGTIKLTQTAAQTAAYTWRRGVYDLEIINPLGEVQRLLQGEIEVSLEVTR